MIRALSRLRDGTRGAVIHPREFREIEVIIRRFANQEGLPQLTVEDSLREFGDGTAPARTLEQVWKIALREADARFRRLCPPKGSLSKPIAAFEPQSILGLVYWMLRRVLIGHGPAQKRCLNPNCNQVFSPSRSSVKYCSVSCRRQVADSRRSQHRANRKAEST
jgi:hypothetical protein